MIRTLDLISNHRRGGSTTNHNPQDRCRISDDPILGWRRKLLYASASLFVLKCISNAPLAGQNRLSPLIDSQEQLAPYLTPQRIVKITDDRSINFVCLGEGSPTVVLTAGLGGWSQVWYRIQAPLSLRTRICAWDPAGLGFSSPSSEPQDAVHQTQDLEKALKAARINGPYVMVAHSAGAFVAILFADKQPSNVAGMVLVDPAIPDETAIRERIAPKWATPGRGGPEIAAERLQQCAAKLKSGTLKQGMPEFAECTAQPMPEAFSSLSARLAHLNADPARLLTQASALTNVNSESTREAINPHRSYGDMPLIVLTSGQHPLPPDMPVDVREQIALYFRALVSGQHAYAGLSTRGRSQTVPDSSHFIQFDDPATVIAAIEAVLADIQIQPPK